MAGDQDDDVEINKPVSCCVCDAVCKRSTELTYHFLTHSVLELAKALTIAQMKLNQLEQIDKELNSSKEKKQELVNGEESIEKTIVELTNSFQEQRTPKKSRWEGSRAPHDCSVCGSTLSSRGALTKHMVIHQEKKPFNCDECKVSFNQARDLRTHTMQKHSLQRPHICGICGKGFVHKFYLMEHMTYHTGERQFQCFHCGKRFQAQSALTKHMKRHTQNRDFSCDICPKSFAVKTDLKSHIKLVHEKPACGKGIPIEPLKNLGKCYFHALVTKHKCVN